MTIGKVARTGEFKDRLEEILDAVPREAPGAIIIDLASVKANWRALRDFVAPAQCAAVVKANAYGLGADRIIPALIDAGCKTFFVATLKEAIEARQLVPEADLYLFDGIFPATAKIVADSGAWPVLSSLDEAREWAEHAKQQGPDAALPCALQLDTGLNRLGFDARSLRALAADMHLLGALDVKLVMSHMACADEPDHPMNDSQRQIFEGLRPLVPSAPKSLAASDGLMLGAPYHYDMVRPGYALYGGQAFQGAPTPVSPVLRAYARVIQVRDVAPNHAVGYSASYKLDRQSRVATLALGYDDGFPRHMSVASTQSTNRQTHPTPSVAFKGKLAPVLGRVSMDLITVDVTDIEDPPVQRGDWAQVIGPDISLEDIGAASQTIGYEILTRLGTRFHRTYVAVGS